MFFGVKIGVTDFMLNLPKTTDFNKRIPKQKFYENLTITTALKNEMKDAIRTIYWRNKIAISTMNLAEGNNVTEIEVIEIQLNRPRLDENVLRQIDREIPYHILFLLEYDNKYQAWIGYKEAAASSANVFKVSGYYHTVWLVENELQLKVEGLDMDAVYENFVRQIAGDRLQLIQGEALEEAVVRSEKKMQLEKQIERLRVKRQREKQLNRQVELNAEIKKLRKELEEL